MLFRLLFPSSKSSSSKTTPGESMIFSPRSSCTVCSSFVWPGCAATAHTYRTASKAYDMHCDLRVRWSLTFDRLSELMRLLLPTLGYPTMPTVMLCELGLYALSSRRSAGAVEDERFDRWWLPADLNGSVGVVCRR